MSWVTQQVPPGVIQVKLSGHPIPFLLRINLEVNSVPMNTEIQGTTLHRKVPKTFFFMITKIETFVLNGFFHRHFYGVEVKRNEYNPFLEKTYGNSTSE